MTLTGRAASEHVARQKARKPRPFDAAETALTSRGLLATRQFVVLLEQSSSTTAGKIRTLADTIEDDGVQVIFEYYSGGSSTTWQGAVYAENFDTGEIRVWEDQIETADQTFPVLYETLIYHEGGGPSDKDPVGLERGIRSEASQHKVMQEFVRCLFTCCSGMAYGCIGSGMGWPACFIIGCFGVCHPVCALDVIFFR